MAEPLAQPRPARRVPRWVWFVAACMALGAMTSVGVAWGIAWRYPAMIPRGHEDYACGRFGELPAGIAWAAELGNVEGYSCKRFGTTDTAYQQRVAEYLEKKGVDADEKFKDATRDAVSHRAMNRHAPLVGKTDRFGIGFAVHMYGWPLKCLGCEDAFSRQDSLRLKAFGDGRWPDRPPIVIDPAFNLSTHYSALAVDTALLPLYPLWPGLLANIALYGAAWLVVISRFIAARRWLRARRGGCPQCGYSREGLKVDAPCPECGRTPVLTPPINA